MRIETGTTNERLARCGIFALALLLFAGWFYKDGWYTYPRKALESFQRYLQLEKLPEPHPKLDYKHPERMQQEYQEKVAKGLTKKDVLKELGEPLVVKKDPTEKVDDWHYVGQYCRLHYEVERTGDPNVGKVVAAHLEPAPHRYEYDSVQQQKLWAGVCGALALIVLAWTVYVWRTKVVVDESGLVYNGKHITWDEMVDIDGSDYAAKGWITLYYHREGAEKKMRLDSFKINAYREVIGAICGRRGFVNPLPIDDYGDVPIDEENVAERQAETIMEEPEPDAVTPDAETEEPAPEPGETETDTDADEPEKPAP